MTAMVLKTCSSLPCQNFHLNRTWQGKSSPSKNPKPISLGCFKIKKLGFPLSHNSESRDINSFRTRKSRSEDSTETISLAKLELYEAIGKSERGIVTLKDSSIKDKILNCIDILKSENPNSVTTDKSLSAMWRLIWTTEKETLFIFENAKWFGTKAGDAFQIIDVQSKTLSNVITFPPDGTFTVNANIQVVSSQRVDFKFENASLKVNNKTFPIPPFGQGWFENVYLDENLRISFDSRGDYLITEK